MPMTCLVPPGFAAEKSLKGDEILGLWMDEEKDAEIEIYRCGPAYCGKIVWTSSPVYTREDKNDRLGQPRLDDENPDPVLRTRPIAGLRIMDGFVFDGKKWKGGKLYDPKSGRTYSGKMVLKDRDHLYLRGYVVFSFIGRKTVWTRSG